MFRVISFGKAREKRWRIKPEETSLVRPPSAVRIYFVFKINNIVFFLVAVTSLLRSDRAPCCGRGPSKIFQVPEVFAATLHSLLQPILWDLKKKMKMPKTLLSYRMSVGISRSYYVCFLT